ncbi:hypothetical protein V5O48_003811 [Marasmius crinis-equi]|uniref:Transposase n=1 Tax=Marasmius crinis-equi TaxID=585013 RepID=A0ABR3FS23_9AGAR
MPNKEGVNGYHNGTRPPDNELSQYLHDLAFQNLSLEERRRYVSGKFGYFISVAKLKKLNKKFNVPSVRKPPPLPVVITAVCSAAGSDIACQNGPNSIRDQIRQNRRMLIPRDTVRTIMHDNFPNGADLRFPGKHVPRRRGTLKIGRGVHQEVHCDGHEKLSSKALRMGSVGIDIYGMRCHTSGRILHEVAIPHSRCSSTIGHVYLDCAEKYGMIPEKVTVDGGNETGEMYACHVALRQKYRPDLDTESCPDWVSLPSTQNIVIESSWKQMLKFNGKTLRLAIASGFEAGFFVYTNEVHWIWSKVVQTALDEFGNYWNSHKTRRQRSAEIPTGTSPMVIYDFPGDYGLVNCGIPVEQADIEALRASIPRSREDCFRWVPEEWDTRITAAFVDIGSPSLNHMNAWDTFVKLYNLIK